MVEQNGPDYHLSPEGQWERADVFADCPPGVVDANEFLRGQGWERLLTLGEPDGSLSLDTWTRRRGDQSTGSARVCREPGSLLSRRTGSASLGASVTGGPSG